MTKVLEVKKWYTKLDSQIDPKLLSLKNIDDEYYWDYVDDSSIKYFIKNVGDSPWKNHLALSLLCVTDRKLSPSSIYNLMTTINARLLLIFNECNLNDMKQFNYSVVEKYLSGEIATEHSDRQRQMFLSSYNSFVFNMSKWITTQFTNEQQQLFSQYLFPKMPFDHRDFKVRERAMDTAKQYRKQETSAVTPLLPEIRAEGHFRWNQVKRLRRTVNKLLQKVNDNQRSLPINFSYEESEYARERWHFILWDKESFCIKYGVNTSTKNEVFLEFIKAEKLEDGSPGDGLWFLEILKYRLIGSWSNEYLDEDERKSIIDYLEKWGYEDAKNGQAPFSHRTPGLLTQGVFITRNARKFNKILINMEPIYAACLFARFALDIITSSGARMNELLQISYDKSCCIVTIDNSTTPAKKNYIYRLIPKGREIEENYYMPEDVFRSMNDILSMLKEAYKSDSIPDVEYSVPSRKHLMSKKKYIFQYQGRHMNEFTINAIIRFLLHGIIIQTNEGKQVSIKAHLLRHAFATHAVQTEKLPVDIVKNLLHQKDITVTEYYSAPTQEQVSSSIDSLYDNWTSYIDIHKGITRAPRELQEIYDEYKERVGTLSKVVGGICTTDAVCPTKLACVGCAAKVPRPEFEEEILAYLKWAEESEVMFNKKGMLLEAKKMKISKNRAKNELNEIRLIKQYEKDELYEPKVRFTK
ncbi:site-specific integrase [Chengkuizengella marina]|uniref:Site-specific integrase n=1 Tax=Chengkuizengella marina TaxID=2507566 RepID=A0A6N9Q7L2_9BACL|nr:site-specific integrase [Chengkuizengella marina]NBI30895.1 site-specific integrase [Chengkuizengella marina]